MDPGLLNLTDSMLFFIRVEEKLEAPVEDLKKKKAPSLNAYFINIKSIFTSLKVTVNIY